MPMLARPDAAIWYETHGNGPPLLLLAGLASDVSSWAPVLPALARRHRVIVVDNRGVGRTAPATARGGIAAMSDDAAALLAHLGTGPAQVVAHSMGGFVAQDLAARHPGCVDRLVLAATSVRNTARNALLFDDWARALERGADPAAWLRSLFCRMFTPRFFDDAALVAAATEFALRYPYPQSAAGFRTQVAAIAAFDGTALLPRIGAPVCLVRGALDLLFPAAANDPLARALPRAPRHTIAGAAHSIHVEQPEAFVAAVEAFLAGG
jgi:pimeloyl-ACP methyl ester carboxylesterase